MTKCCEMKGFLTFLVLRLMKDGAKSGEDIRQEIKRRKGTKPSPGTIYPVLKHVHENGWIKELKDAGKEKKYEITDKGKKELDAATKKFVALFCDLKEDFRTEKSQPS
ncbi:PadR family transcriptional regulator [Candidatus Woesearchaeota archaeon]|nr:PadR family transcriptional regulator [Candidatus Woesearchaeota archaeon]